MTRKIVSLLPSATEIVCALGGGGELVGRSHECDFPVAVERLPVCTAPKVRVDGNSIDIHASVTEVLANDILRSQCGRGLQPAEGRLKPATTPGTSRSFGGISVYRVHSELLRELKPDVIVTQVQCDVCAVSLRDVEASLADWMDVELPRIVALNPATIDGVCNDITAVAGAIGRDARGFIEAMRGRMDEIARRTREADSRPRVATIEWISPLMTAGNWVPELIELAGGENLLGRAGEHSPWIDLEAFAQADPDVIVVIPCGFPIARSIADMPLLTSQAAWRELRAVRNGKVFVADGNQFFNRPGPRIVESLEILAEVLHPGLFDFGHAATGWVRL